MKSDMKDCVAARPKFRHRRLKSIQFLIDEDCTPLIFQAASEESPEKYYKVTGSFQSWRREEIEVPNGRARAAHGICSSTKSTKHHCHGRRLE